MTVGINRSTEEINRVNKTGGNGTASFVRKETKKAAAYIDKFSLQLRDYNKKIPELWNLVEKNTLGLLENDYTSLPQNTAHLAEFIKTFKPMQDSIFISCESIKGMKDASLGNLGLERTLNQAIHSLDQDLKTNIDIMDFMSSSIDKIINKSRFVIGDVTLTMKE